MISRMSPEREEGKEVVRRLWGLMGLYYLYAGLTASRRASEPGRFYLTEEPAFATIEGDDKLVFQMKSLNDLQLNGRRDDI
jgi:hypothetical protein